MRRDGPARHSVPCRTPCAPPPTLLPPPVPHRPAAAYVRWGSADRQDFGGEAASQPLGVELWLRGLLPGGGEEAQEQQQEKQPGDGDASGGRQKEE